MVGTQAIDGIAWPQRAHDRHHVVEALLAARARRAVLGYFVGSARWHRAPRKLAESKPPQRIESVRVPSGLTQGFHVSAHGDPAVVHIGLVIGLDLIETIAVIDHQPGREFQSLLGFVAQPRNVFQPRAVLYADCT